MKLRRMLAVMLCFAVVATSGATANIVNAQEQGAEVVVNDGQSDHLSAESEDDALNAQDPQQDDGNDSQGTVIRDDQDTENDQNTDERIEDAGDGNLDESEEVTEDDAVDTDKLADVEEAEADEDEGDELFSTNVDNFSVYGSKWVKAADLFGQYAIDNQLPVPAVINAKAGTLPDHDSGLYACFFLPYDKDKVVSLDNTYADYSIEIAAPNGRLLDKLYFRDIDDNYLLRRVVFADADKIADRDKSGNGVVWAADSIEIYTNDDQSDSRPKAKYAKYFYFIDLGEYLSDEAGAYAFRINIGSTGNHSDWCYLDGYDPAPGSSVGVASALKWTKDDDSFDGYVSWTPPGEAPKAYIVKLYKMRSIRDLTQLGNNKVLETDTLIKSVKTDVANVFLITDHGNMTSEEGLKYFYTVRSVSADPLTKKYSETVFSAPLAVRLSSPTSASWNNTSSAHWKWKKTTDADGKIKQFSVTMLKNGEAVSTKVYPGTDQPAIDITGAEMDYSVSFADELKGITPSSADYTFTVTAVTDKDNRPFVASSVSAESDSPWAGEALGTLVWDTGKASIVHFHVGIEGEYTLYLYKDKKSIYQKSLGKLVAGDYYYDLKEYMEIAGQYQAKVTEKTDKTFNPATEIHSLYQIQKLPSSISFVLTKGTDGEQILKITDNMASNTTHADAFSGGNAGDRGKGQFDVKIGSVRFRATATDNYTAVIPNLDTYIVRAGSKDTNDIKVRALSADTSKCLHSEWVTYKGANNKVNLNVTGKAGADIDYKLTGKKDDVRLVLTGSGLMYDYFNPDEVIPAGGSVAPWAGLGSSLKSITIDDRITRIGNYAFINNTGITAVKMPSALEEIGDYSFYGCKGLKTVEFPMNVSAIGQCAFGNITALSKGVFTGAAPTTVSGLRDENGKIDAKASFYQSTTLYYSPRYTEGWTNAIKTVNKVRYWKDYKVAESVIPLEKITVKYSTTNEYDNRNINVYTSIGAGQLNVKAFPEPADASNTNITWKSSNTSVAKVLSSSGNSAKLELTGKAGYATITAVSKYSSKITDTLVIAAYASTDKNLDKNKGGYWVKSGSNYYYMEMKEDGTKKVVTGWQKVPTYNDWTKWNSSNNASKISETGDDSLASLSEWHYFNTKTGARMTGWLTEYEKDKNGDQILYYLDPTKGSITLGHKKISGKWYYFNEASATVNVTPKTCNEGPRNYTNSQIIGCAKIGWLGNNGYTDGTKFYNKNGQALIGWNEVGEDKWFYFDGNGTKQTYWTKVGSNIYYLGQYGIKQYGNPKTTTYKGMKTYSELDLTGGGALPTDKTVSGGINKFLLTGMNYDNKTETNNGKLVSGWDGNNEKYYNPTTFQMQTGFVKVGNYYYFLKSIAETGGVTAETGKKIRYTGTSSDGIVDYYMEDGVMTILPNVPSAEFDALTDNTPIYRFNKNGVLTKTYRKADYNIAVPTENKNTANGVYEKAAGLYYYIKSGNFGTGFIDVTTKSAKVLAPTTTDPDATKNADVKHTWYFDAEDSLARRGIQNINGKYYLFDQEFHQVKEKTYFTKPATDPAVYSNETYPAHVFVNIKNLTPGIIHAYNKTGDDLVHTIIKPAPGGEVDMGLYKKDSDEDHTYWFKGGVLTTGWFKASYPVTEGTKTVTKYDYFYFDPTTGDNYGRKLTNGWYNISGSWYEFDAEGKAVIHTAKGNDSDKAMTATLTPMNITNIEPSGTAKDYYKLTDSSGKSKGWTTLNAQNKAVNPDNGFYNIEYKADGVYTGVTDAGVTYLTKGVAGNGFKTIKCASGFTDKAKDRKFYFEPTTGVMKADGFAKIGGKFYYFYTGTEKLGDPDSTKNILTGGDYVKGQLAGNVWLAVVTVDGTTTTYVIPAVADATRGGNIKKYYTDKYRNGPVDATLEKDNTRLYYIQSDGTVKTGWLTLSYKASYTDDYKDPITKEQPKNKTISIKEYVYFNPVTVPVNVAAFNNSTYGQMQRSKTVDNGNYHVDKYGIRQ